MSIKQVIFSICTLCIGLSLCRLELDGTCFMTHMVHMQLIHISSSSLALSILCNYPLIFISSLQLSIKGCHPFATNNLYLFALFSTQKLDYLAVDFICSSSYLRTWQVLYTEIKCNFYFYLLSCSFYHSFI